MVWCEWIHNHKRTRVICIVRIESPRDYTNRVLISPTGPRLTTGFGRVTAYMKRLVGDMNMGSKRLTNAGNDV
jgi:hypothetical protein